MTIDEGTLTNKAQLPVTSLNYGDSYDRFSWVLYQLGFLECRGKAKGALYPSEHYQNIITTIEDDIDELKGRTEDNEKDIFSLSSRTSTLEDIVIEEDYYFHYKGDTYVRRKLPLLTTEYIF